MLVQTLSRDGRIVGLRIGAENVRRYFPVQQATIELVLGHLHIHCELPPEFWEGEPELFDSRLADWLEAKFRCSRKPGACVSLMLVKAGDGSYRLELPRTAPEKPAAKPAAHTVQPSAD